VFSPSLEALLLAYNSSCEQQEKLKQQMLNFLSNSDCFERGCVAGHFTASALLLDRDQQKALLMHHRKLNKWVQVGGHCDGNPDVLAVAIQEAQEESGIKSIIPVTRTILDLDIHLIPGNNFEAEHLHYDVRFLLKVNSDEALHGNDESLDVRWFANDLATLPTASQSVTRLFDKWALQCR